MFCQLSVIAHGLLRALPRPVAGFKGDTTSKEREGRGKRMTGKGKEGKKDGRE